MQARLEPKEAMRLIECTVRVSPTLARLGVSLCD